MKDITYMVIHEDADGVRWIKVGHWHPDDFDNMVRDNVEGYFEIHNREFWSMWMDEDGLMHNRTENKIASGMLGTRVVGRVVVTGPPVDGEPTSVKPLAIAQALRLMTGLAELEI